MVSKKKLRRNFASIPIAIAIGFAACAATDGWYAYHKEEKDCGVRTHNSTSLLSMFNEFKGVFSDAAENATEFIEEFAERIDDELDKIENETEDNLEPNQNYTWKGKELLLNQFYATDNKTLDAILERELREIRRKSRGQIEKLFKMSRSLEFEMKSECHNAMCKQLTPICKNTTRNNTENYCDIDCKKYQKGFKDEKLWNAVCRCSYGKTVCDDKQKLRACASNEDTCETTEGIVGAGKTQKEDIKKAFEKYLEELREKCEQNKLTYKNNGNQRLQTWQKCGDCTKDNKLTATSAVCVYKFDSITMKDKTQNCKQIANKFKNLLTDKTKDFRETFDKCENRTWMEGNVTLAELEEINSEGVIKYKEELNELYFEEYTRKQSRAEIVEIQSKYDQNVQSITAAVLSSTDAGYFTNEIIRLEKKRKESIEEREKNMKEAIETVLKRELKKGADQLKKIYAASKDGLEKAVAQLKDRKQRYYLAVVAFAFAVAALIFVTASGIVAVLQVKKLRFVVMALCGVAALLHLIALGCGSEVVHRMRMDEKEEDERQMKNDARKTERMVNMMGYEMWTGPFGCAFAMLFELVALGMSF